MTDDPIDFAEYKKRKKEKAKKPLTPEGQKQLKGLSEMSRVDYGRKRESIAEETGISLKYLDKEYESRRRDMLPVNDGQKAAISLWAVLTWVHDAAVHSPILLVTSPEAECGKTTLLGILALMVLRGLQIVEISPAALPHD